MSLFHGLNEIFVVNDSMPMYNGPMSTTLAKSVAHSFSDNKGLLWTIKPSYANKFKFVVGINIAWISQFKAESEVLLFNQFIPIQSIHNFEDNQQNHIDHLMVQLKEFKHKTNKKQFYRQIGFSLQKEWIKKISSHYLLFEISDYNPNKTVLHRLVEELKVNELSNILHVFESKFKFTDRNKVFNYDIYTIDDKQTNISNDIFMQCDYKIINDDHKQNVGEFIFKYNDAIKVKSDHNYSIFICNDNLFGRNDNEYIFLQKINSKKIINNNGKNKHDEYYAKTFCDRLELINDAIITLHKKKETASLSFKYEFDFDENGLLYALGSDFGKKDYKNPAKSGIVKITASEMYSDTRKPYNFNLCGKCDFCCKKLCINLM